MHRIKMGVIVAATAGATALSVLGAAGASASGTATPGAQLWVTRYGPSGNGIDQANSVAVSPDGRKVFVTGQSKGATSGPDYATIAYTAATGARLWVARYNGPGNGIDVARSVTVSPDGRKVFVTGQSKGTTSRGDYATIAYSASTGARLWVARYNGPGNGIDAADSVTVSPDGRKVFVTGQSKGATSGPDYATLAYSAATGARLWVARYNGPANGIDEAVRVAVSPLGGTVFVTGGSEGKGVFGDYATIAYNTATGARLWVARYNGPGNGGDAASSLVVSPGGRTVFVTGSSMGTTAGEDYTTIAYNPATGHRLWISRYNGTANDSDYATSIAVGPGGGKVFVTGYSPGRTSAGDYATISYSAVTGARLWVSRYNGPGNGLDFANSLAVSSIGPTVFVTGTSVGATSGEDYATISYQG